MTLILIVITGFLIGLNYVFIFLRPSKNRRYAQSETRNNPVLKSVAEVWALYEFGARPIHGIKFVLPFFPVYMKMFDMSILDILLLFFILVGVVILIGIVIDRLDLINYLSDQSFARYGNMMESIKRGEYDKRACE